MVLDGDLNGEAQLAFGDLGCFLFALFVNTAGAYVDGQNNAKDIFVVNVVQHGELHLRLLGEASTR